jgi:hypothetical protein
MQAILHNQDNIVMLEESISRGNCSGEAVGQLTGYILAHGLSSQGAIDAVFQTADYNHSLTYQVLQRAFASQAAGPAEKQATRSTLRDYSALAPILVRPGRIGSLST